MLPTIFPLLTEKIGFDVFVAACHSIESRRIPRFDIDVEFVRVTKDHKDVLSPEVAYQYKPVT